MSKYRNKSFFNTFALCVFVYFSCEIEDGQIKVVLRFTMAVLNREELFYLCKKITSPSNLDKWKAATGIVLYEEVKTRFLSSSKPQVDKDSFLLVPAVESFVKYFSEETHKHWGKSNSDVKKCIRQHGKFFAVEVDFSKIVESLDLTSLPAQGGAAGDDIPALSTVYRHADKMVEEFSADAIFKAAQKKLKELGFVDAAFIWSELTKNPVDLGSKLRRAMTVDFDSLKPKVPRISAGELILNNGLTVSTYKVPLTSCFKH